MVSRIFIGSRRIQNASTDSNSDFFLHGRGAWGITYVDGLIHQANEERKKALVVQYQILDEDGEVALDELDLEEYEMQIGTVKEIITVPGISSTVLVKYAPDPSPQFTFNGVAGGDDLAVGDRIECRWLLVRVAGGSSAMNGLRVCGAIQ